MSLFLRDLQRAGSCCPECSSDPCACTDGPSCTFSCVSKEGCGAIAGYEPREARPADPDGWLRARVTQGGTEEWHYAYSFPSTPNNCLPSSCIDRRKRERRGTQKIRVQPATIINDEGEEVPACPGTTEYEEDTLEVWFSNGPCTPSATWTAESWVFPSASCDVPQFISDCLLDRVQINPLRVESAPGNLSPAYCRITGSPPDYWEGYFTDETTGWWELSEPVYLHDAVGVFAVGTACSTLPFSGYSWSPTGSGNGGPVLISWSSGRTVRATLYFSGLAIGSTYDVTLTLRQRDYPAGGTWDASYTVTLTVVADAESDTMTWDVPVVDGREVELIGCAIAAVPPP